MKKVLFASTALVAFGGAAVADVALSGRAEMGIADSDSGVAGENVSTQFFTDIDVTFTMTGETDNGLTFGASVDLDEGGDGSSASDDNTDDGGATIFISGGFGTVTMGDTDGAMDWALTEAGNIGNGGSIADDETSHEGYLGSYLDGAFGQDGQILRWDYSSGAFGVAISFEQGDRDLGATTGVADESDGFALGFKYALDLSGTTVNFGLGYQSISDASDASVAGAFDVDTIGVSVNAAFANGLSAGIVFSDIDSDDAGNTFDGDHIGLGLGYTTGALTLHANYGKFEVDNGGEAEGFGLSAAYDLGGGAVVHFGYGDSEVTDAAGASVDSSSVSLGLGLSF
ncbi:outer membrane protein OmpU [Litoreibacter ponti]|uniref:Outer membrane protein OmpU n=1 Tax=Litoreibacter ponti TaxID=1510457 RepID=A0A2T6BNP9_9RHOB|nr:porin [Litoreibacter ponti]PTX57710.1 outer membrane protein OmpU [Litoreibacter ponti]